VPKRLSPGKEVTTPGYGRDDAARRITLLFVYEEIIARQQHAVTLYLFDCRDLLPGDNSRAQFAIL